MPRNRLFCTLAVLAVVGAAACNKADNQEGAVTDTLITTDTVTQKVEVAVPDTQAVITSVDTTVDTVDINR